MAAAVSQLALGASAVAAVPQPALGAAAVAVVPVLALEGICLDAGASSRRGAFILRASVLTVAASSFSPRRRLLLETYFTRIIGLWSSRQRSEY